jgi:hypothetical protein
VADAWVTFYWNFELSSAAKRINQAKRVFIIGIGQLGPIAVKLTEGLKLLSKETILLTDLGFSKLAEIHSSNSKDVIIAFSINNELVELQEFLRQSTQENIFSSLLFSLHRQKSRPPTKAGFNHNSYPIHRKWDDQLPYPLSHGNKYFGVVYLFPR